MISISYPDPRRRRFCSQIAGKTVPQWLSEKKRRSLSTDVDYRRRIELLQDFDFPTASQKVRVSHDGEYVIVAGTYPPQIKGEKAICCAEFLERVGEAFKAVWARGGLPFPEVLSNGRRLASARSGCACGVCVRACSVVRVLLCVRSTMAYICLDIRGSLIPACSNLFWTPVG